MRHLIAPLAVLVPLAACRAASPSSVSAAENARIVDLTHAFDADTVYWPTAAQGFELRSDAKGVTPGGFYYEANSFSGTFSFRYWRNADLLLAFMYASVGSI